MSKLEALKSLEESVMTTEASRQGKADEFRKDAIDLSKQMYDYVAKKYPSQSSSDVAARRLVKDATYGIALLKDSWWNHAENERRGDLHALLKTTQKYHAQITALKDREIQSMFDDFAGALTLLQNEI